MKFLYVIKIYLYFLADIISNYWETLRRREITGNYACVRGHVLETRGEKCTTLVRKTPPCGHVTQIPCYFPPEDWKCQQRVKKLREACGHDVTVPCGDQVFPRCMMLCRRRLPCGHDSKGLFPCSDDAPPEVCLQRQRKILDCGHVLYIPCGGTLRDGQCKKILEKKLPYCDHEITRYCFEDVSQEICIACGDDTKIELGEKVIKNPPRRAWRPGNSVGADEATMVSLEESQNLTAVEIIKRCAHGEDSLQCCKDCSRRCPRGHLCPARHPCHSPCPPCESLEKISFQSCAHQELRICSEIKEWTPLCDRVCQQEMNCGHDCGKPCRDHVEGKCPRCSEASHSVPMKCQHFCKVPCAEHCVDPNGDLVCPPCEHGWKACKFGHTTFVGCETTDIEAHCKAEDSIEVELSCGKRQTFRIHCRDRGEFPLEAKSVTNHSLHCSAPCGVLFNSWDESCGHICPGRCSDCYARLIHQRCSEPCGKVLPCFHLCTRPCGEMCGPCESSCENECEHRRCGESCGTPCEACQEPCTYQCAHLKCTRLCYQVCDRGPCTVPCPKFLSCSHSCSGYCGEVCPSLCRYCDRKRIEFELKRKVRSRDRLIQLPCGHIVLEEILKEMFGNPESRKLCPTCSKFIYNCKRYSPIIQKAALEMMRAKIKLGGGQKSIQDSQLRAWAYLQPQQEIQNKDFKQLEPFKKHILGMLAIYDLFTISDQTISLKKMSFHEAESLEFLSLIHRNLVLKLCSLENHKVPVAVSQLFLTRILKLVEAMMTLRIPLYHQEILDIKRECRRLLDLYRLLLLRSDNGAVPMDLIQNGFKATLAILTTPAPYSDTLRGDYFENLTEIVKLLEPLRLYVDFSDGGDDQKLKLISYKKILT
ncbi:unnamed protein product [Allacma fusca]|uniref:NFX1-type zinc finger-containing protein 1 n=1 Tax=Allacma fusca TaxID=39272 RepID=A0A8J2PN14_9HEXA|nr:unnamed protein product [Allacma fusca]